MVFPTPWHNGAWSASLARFGPSSITPQRCSWPRASLYDHKLSSSWRCWWYRKEDVHLKCTFPCEITMPWILLYLSIMLMWSSVGRHSFDATHNNPSFAHFCFSSLTGNRQATTSSYRRFPYALQQNERTAEEEERDSKKTDTHSLIKPTLPSCNTQLNKDSFLVKSYLLPLPSAWARRVSESTLLQSVFVVHAHTR